MNIKDLYILLVDKNALFDTQELFKLHHDFLHLGFTVDVDNILVVRHITLLGDFIMDHKATREILLHYWEMGHQGEDWREDFLWSTELDILALAAKNKEVVVHLDSAHSEGEDIGTILTGGISDNKGTHWGRF